MPRDFERGQVFYASLPDVVFNKRIVPPSFTIKGRHMVVALHDSKDRQYDPRQVLVAPITAAEAARSMGRILPSHVPINQGDYDFIKKDCYVSTHQVMPINREWLDLRPEGKFDNDLMWGIDLGLIHAGGLMKTVMDYAREQAQDLLQQHAKQLRLAVNEIAPTSDKPSARDDDR